MLLTFPVAPSCLEAYRASGSHHPFPTLGPGSVNTQGGLTHRETQSEGVRLYKVSEISLAYGPECLGFAEGEQLTFQCHEDVTQVRSDAPAS